MSVTMVSVYQVVEPCHLICLDIIYLISNLLFLISRINRMRGRLQKGCQRYASPSFRETCWWMCLLEKSCLNNVVCLQFNKDLRSSAKMNARREQVSTSYHILKCTQIQENRFPLLEFVVIFVWNVDVESLRVCQYSVLCSSSSLVHDL
jgi:hypothetical protein